MAELVVCCFGLLLWICYNLCGADTVVTTLYTLPGESIDLQCGTIPSDTTFVRWRFRGSLDVLVAYRFSDRKILDPNGNYNTQKYKYSTNDHSLTIINITHDDLISYLCQLQPTASQGSLKNELKLAVTPASVSVVNTLPKFLEEIGTKVEYWVPAVIPGKGYITFKVKVGSSIKATSTKDDLDETLNMDKSVSVKYSPMITLKREHNGMAIMCEVVWRTNTHLESSAGAVYVKFEPRTVSMTTTHSHPVAVNIEVTLTCVTDEGNPTPTIVWEKNNLNIEHQPSGVDVTETRGQYNANKTQSVLRITASKELNDVIYKCNVGGLTQSHLLRVQYPPSVTVTELTNDVKENQPFTLSCDTSGGNPTDVWYKWEVKHRYSNSPALQLTTTKYMNISPVLYQHAGNYTCTATNAGGSSKGTASVFVKYSPKDFSSANQTVTSTGLNNATELSCTVLSYPQLQQEHVTVQLEGMSVIPAINIRALPRVDEYLVKMPISNVTRADFGNYTFIINNGIGTAVNITIELREKGRPDFPKSVSYTNVTAHTAVVTWIAGHTGGSPQTFKIYYKESDSNSFQQTKSIADPGVEFQTQHRIENLKEQTSYNFKVVAENRNDAPNNIAETRLFDFQTLGIPLIVGPRQAVVSGIDVTFSWPKIEGYFTKVIIEKCASVICETIQEITDSNTISFTLTIKEPQMFTYKLSVYQHHEKVYQNEFKWQEKIPEEGSKIGITVGAILGVVVAIILIVVIVSVLLVRKRVLKKGTSKEPEFAAPEILDNPENAEGGDAYAAVDMSAKKNKKNKKKDANEGDAYAAVDMSAKKNKKNEKKDANEDASKKKPKTGTKSKGLNDGAMDYANVAYNGLDPINPDDQNTYANVGNHGAAAAGPDIPVSEDEKVMDADGLMYAQVDFVEKKGKPVPPSRPKIHGEENKTIYAAIDFSKSGPQDE